MAGHEGSKGRSGGIAVLFLQPRRYIGVGVQRHAPAALPPRKKSGTHSTAGWVGPRVGLDECGKSRHHRYSIPGLPSP
jgi:hypothetical protein